MHTFDGKESIRALKREANLHYFLIKDHPFISGNKRIGAALFWWFRKNWGSPSYLHICK